MKDPLKHIFFKKLHPLAVAPQRAHNSDAGNDLFAVDDVLIRPGERRLFNTGIGVEIPEGFYGHVCPRSGLAAKCGITVLGGVIDSLFRGPIGVILINLGELPVEIQTGDKIAQLIIKSCELPKWIEVDELSETVRGDNGFGSSGV